MRHENFMKNGNFKPDDAEEDCGSELYDGTRKPKCNRGLGCVACWEAWFETNEKEGESK